MGSLMVSGIARLTRDAEARKTSMGTWYNVGVAAFRKNPKEGKQQVDFFDADLYLKSPPPRYEVNLVKGRLIYIETAYLRNDQFTGSDGKEKNRIKLQISGFELLGDPSIKIEDKPAVIKTASIAAVHPSDLGPPMEKPTPFKYHNEEPVEDTDEDDEVPF